MLKRFGITLIVVSTLFYGYVFFMAKYNGTSFFDEILIQSSRVATSLNKKQEVKQSKKILKIIIENEHPTENWKDLIVRNPQKDSKELFYYYKIWTLKTKLNNEDVSDSYPIFEKTKKNIIFINMRYSRKKIILQFPFFKDKSGNIVTGLFFPINEKPMSADYNNDNTVNYQDVILARKTQQ